MLLATLLGLAGALALLFGLGLVSWQFLGGSWPGVLALFVLLLLWRPLFGLVVLGAGSLVFRVGYWWARWKASR